MLISAGSGGGGGGVEVEVAAVAAEAEEEEEEEEQEQEEEKGAVSGHRNGSQTILSEEDEGKYETIRRTTV